MQKSSENTRIIHRIAWAIFYATYYLYKRLFFTLVSISFRCLSRFSFFIPFFSFQRLSRDFQKLNKNANHFSSPCVNRLRHKPPSISATKRVMLVTHTFFFGYFVSFFGMFFWLEVINVSWKPPQHANILFLFFLVIVNVCLVRHWTYSIAFAPFFHPMFFFICFISFSLRVLVISLWFSYLHTLK